MRILIRFTFFLSLAFTLSIFSSTAFAEEDPLEDLESDQFVHESSQGPGLKGESSDFQHYLDEAKGEDDDAIELMRIDEDSRIAFDTEEDAELALQMEY